LIIEFVEMNGENFTVILEVVLVVWGYGVG
jgi:hypothetical protein